MALVIVGLAVLVFHVTVLRWRVKHDKSKRGLSTLFLGRDNRTSTSKLTATAWTLVLIYAFLVLILTGRFPTDDETLSSNYMFLLGGPFAAAIGAKLFTGSKVDDGTLDKSSAQDEKTSASERVAESISDDDGNIDLLDFQYVGFTIVTIIYFFVAFVSDPTNGLPQLSDTLVGLSTASAAGYLAKKGVDKDPGAFKALSAVPTKIVLGVTATVVIAGDDFIKEDGEAKDANAVMLDGIELNVITWKHDLVTAGLENWADKGLGANPRADLVVRNHAGRLSEPVKVQVIEA